MRLGKIFTVLLILDILTPVPLWMWLGYLGIGIWVVLFSVSMYIAVLCEKQKKKLNIQTYQEILAFMEGKNLTSIERAREEGKRPYQKLLMAVVVGVITFIVGMIMGKLLGLF